MRSMVSSNVYNFVHAELRLDYLTPGMRTFVSDAEKKVQRNTFQNIPRNVEMNERVNK